MSANEPLNPISSTRGKQKVDCGSGGGFDYRPEIEAQDFYQLRTQCLAKGILFEDPVFSPTTIPVDENHIVREWKRPGEIVPNPQFFKDGFSRFDVKQYGLSNCWFLATMANLASFSRSFSQVVPEDQNFEENYAGIFHFRFWHFGRWIDVVVDDRLPLIDNKLIFARSSEPNEFWSALLEKAYAKVIGSYELLEGGSISEAMEDFTGGACERYRLEEAPSNLFEILLQAHERGSMIGCSTKPDPEVKEARTPEGLVLGHAYSLTKVALVDGKSKKHQLVRIRNPWGDEMEWKGRWSDRSEEWSHVSAKQKKDLDLTCNDDGEFWMAYEDFLAKFYTVEICYLAPESLPEGQGTKKKWFVSMFQGKWAKGLSAGGSPDNETFFKNPQYRFTLSEVDEGDKNGYCTVIISVMQSRRQRGMNKEEMLPNFLPQSFDIWRIYFPDKAPKPLDMAYFDRMGSIASYPSYNASRGITHRFQLPKGTYCLVPSTFEPDEEAEFFLRVIAGHDIKVEEYGNCTK